MSGLEVVGTVASILQIVELGTKLSLKLSAFYRAAKAANESMKGLSSDVTLTCTILKELAKVLDQDKDVKAASNSAFETAQKVIDECKLVFEDIRLVIERQERESEQSRLLRTAHKITTAFRGPDLETLKVNLDRLKSTVLLMLNVMIYAGQVHQ
ncbi:hypothetical protein N7540_001662 [Penicillium herquei]|nr:hypothetical protein N7540_001662 [Penicillium herquei]